MNSSQSLDSSVKMWLVQYRSFRSPMEWKLMIDRRIPQSGLPGQGLNLSVNNEGWFISVSSSESISESYLGRSCSKYAKSKRVFDLRTIL